MEPARGERDDVASFRSTVKSGVVPQWSPLVVSGMTDDPGSPSQVGEQVPQWSPLVVSGMTSTHAETAESQLAGRNGARSW